MKKIKEAPESIELRWPICIIGTIAAGVILILCLHGCKTLQSLDYEPAQLCGAVCAIQSIAGAECMEDNPDFWGPIQGAYDTAQCMTACDNNWNVYEALDYQCLLNQYVKAETGKACPDIGSCFQ